MQLKIASISNLTDARYFSAVGANYLGFCFDALAENNIPIATAKEIINWIHHPDIVGEFGIHQPLEEIQFLAQEFGLNGIQVPYLHMQREQLSFQKFLYMEDWKEISGIASTDVLVVKIKKEDIQHPNLKQLVNSNKLFIDIGLDKATVLNAIEHLNPYGIQLTCKLEEKIGWSSVDEYAEILEAIGY